MMHVANENDRIDAAVTYCKKVICELNRQIAECDYEELPDGTLQYTPGVYSQEKSELLNERQKWDVMMAVLTGKFPFTVIDL